MRAWIGVLSAAVNTLPRLRFQRGLVCGSRGTAPLLSPLRLSKDMTAVTGVLFRNCFIFWTTHPRNALAAIVCA
jgi:hypothetical protein